MTLHNSSVAACRVTGCAPVSPATIVDDNVNETIETYLPRMRGSKYGAITIRQALQMSSGIRWSEGYDDPDSDVVKAALKEGIALTDYLATLPQLHEAGTKFNYNTAESIRQVPSRAIRSRWQPA